MNIFISNLSQSMTTEDLRTAFGAYGEIQAVSLLKNKTTKQPNGFGFVQMPIAREANEAIVALDGKTIAGQAIHVFKVTTGTDCVQYYKVTHPDTKS